MSDEEGDPRTGAPGGTLGRRADGTLAPGNQTKAPNWRPGQSGNPGGRPKGASLVAAFRRLLLKPVAHVRRVADDEREIAVERIAARHVLAVVEGGDLANLPAFLREAYDRADGKAPAHVDISHDVSRTVEVIQGPAVHLALDEHEHEPDTDTGDA